MDTLNIDINGTPPTQEAIFQLRKMAGEQIRLADKKAGLFHKFAASLIALSVMAVLAMGWSGIGVGTVVGTVIGVGFGALAGSISAAGSVIIVGVGFGAFFCFGLVAGLVAFIGVGLGAMVGAVGWIWAETIYEKRIEKPRTAAEQQLEALVDLNVDDDGLFAFIAYDTWCDQEASIKAYQSKIMTEGRKPVMAEYEAAKSWVASTTA